MIEYDGKIDVIVNNVTVFPSSSSFPLAFPVIWGRRYGC